MQHREVPLTPDAHEALLQQREAFIEKFGREPGPDDPVFFDPDADTPEPLDLEGYEKDLADAMVAAGIDPRLIYASRKTGLLVTEENLDKLPGVSAGGMERGAGRVRRTDGGRTLVKGIQSARL